MILSMKMCILNHFIYNDIWPITKTFVYIKFFKFIVVTKIPRVFILGSEDFDAFQVSYCWRIL